MGRTSPEVHGSLYSTFWHIAFSLMCTEGLCVRARMPLSVGSQPGGELSNSRLESRAPIGHACIPGLDLDLLLRAASATPLLMPRSICFPKLLLHALQMQASMGLACRRAASRHGHRTG